MSKKSHPGDGEYGRGVKGFRPEFEPLFEKSPLEPTPPARQLDQEEDPAQQGLSEISH